MAKIRPPLLVSAAIIIKNGQVLLGQRRKGDRHPFKWEFPGGKVEHGESPRQALIRELREELRIEAEIGDELARYEHDYPSGSRVHLLFFVVKELRRRARSARVRTNLLGGFIHFARYRFSRRRYRFRQAPRARRFQQTTENLIQIKRPLRRRTRFIFFRLF